MPWRSAQRVYMRSSMRGPVLDLGAAGAGVDLHEGVVAVGLAGQQRLQPRGAARSPRRALSCGLASARAASSPSASASSAARRVGEVALQPLHGLDRLASAGARASGPGRPRRRPRASGPRPGRSARRGGARAVSQSKTPPEQCDRLADGSTACSALAVLLDMGMLDRWTILTRAECRVRTHKSGSPYEAERGRCRGSDCDRPGSPGRRARRRRTLGPLLGGAASAARSPSAGAVGAPGAVAGECRSRNSVVGLRCRA